MGGAVVMSAAGSAKPPDVQGIILVSPAVWGWRTQDLPSRVALWTAAHSLPWGKLSGDGLGIVPSDNVEMLRALSKDPLYQHRARADAVYGLVTLMDEGYNAAPHIGLPVLFMYGDKDQVIPRDPLKGVVAKLGPNATVKEYPNGYHMLLRDLEGPNLWRDILDWTNPKTISVD